ncbi:MAG: ABC transporter ATP-binding protein, partial [Aggregatilineales bacterium]
KMQTGELIQRATSDIDALRRFFAEQAIGIGRIMFLFLVNFIALLTLHWQLAIVSVIVIPLIIMLSLYFFGKLSKAWDEFQTQEGKLSAALQENLSGVRVVKAFARQPYEIDRFETENKERYRLGVRFTMMHSAYWPITDILTGAQAVIGFYLAAMLVINNGTATLGPITLTGEFTIGMFIAYSAMIWWIIEPVRNLGRLIVQMSTGLVSYDRVMEIIREDRELIGKDDPAPMDNIYGNIVFENVMFSYEDGNPVLNDISFTVNAGQTVALLGSTGSGKSSMISLLPRFYDYDSGSIRLEGNELNTYPKRFLRANIGVVEQEPFLFSRSLRDNITYGVSGDVSDDDVIAAAKAAAVHDVIMTFPEGYETMVGERGVTLSGGQKQRVALARTLLKNPRILILDDATSSVDTQTEYDIREALNNLMSNRTSFIIAHRIQSVMDADLILVMDKGHIVQRGTHDSLMQEDGIYRRTYDMQARIEEELEKELSGV